MANISQIKLPNGTTYDIYDASAIHSVEDLGLSGVLTFRGIKASYNELMAVAPAKAGDVWIVSGSGTTTPDGPDYEDQEYVCLYDITTADNLAWEKLGSLHDAASSTHKHTVTIAGSNAASKVSGTITTTVPTVSKTSKYLNATATQGTVTKPKDEVLGAGTKFNVSGGGATTQGLYAQRSTDVAVGANGTAKAITALGTPTTAKAITDLNTTTIKNPTVTPVSIPNVTGNTTVTIPNVTSVGSRTNGTAASWGASVSNGVLSFSWTANTPTTVTMPTLGTALTATNTTLGTALSASSVSTSDVTVATSSKTTADAITGFGTHTTANALTGVKVTTQPVVTLGLGSTDEGEVEVVTEVGAVTVTADSSDRVNAVTDVSVANPTVTLNNTGNSGVAFVDTVTIGSTSATATHDLTAAAQQWTQGTTTVSTPV